MIFALKIYKIPDFQMILAGKMPKFYIIARKIFLSGILGGHVPSPAPHLLRL